MRFSPTQQRRATLNRCLQRSNVLFHIGCTTHKNNSWLYLNLNCIPNILILIQYLTKPTGRPDDHLQEAGPSGVWMIICKRQMVRVTGATLGDGREGGEERKGEEGKEGKGEIGEEGGGEITGTSRNLSKLGQHSQNPSIFAFCKLFPPIPTCMITTQSAKRCTGSCLELRSPHLGSAASPLLYCQQL